MMDSLDSPTLGPLAELPIDLAVAALPKADIHLHQEWSPRLDRVLARRAGRLPYDWKRWARDLMAQTPPGMPRLELLAKVFPASVEDDADPENFTARIEDLLEEGAADGAILVEMRFGGRTALAHPDFMERFHEAERRVRQRHPRLRAAALYTLLLYDEPEVLEQVALACLRAAGEGLSGIDPLYAPYATEADWLPIYRLVGRLADAGLGVTAHVGEFSPANIIAALRTPGLTRLGHAGYAASDPRLLEAIAASGATVECSLTCNVVLGAVSSYGAHPVRRLLESGIPVALCTDNPVQMDSAIGREYAVARTLGLSIDELLGCTAAAIQASFLPVEQKQALLAEVRRWPVRESVSSGEDV